MPREIIPFQILPENYDSAKFELLLTIQASINILHDSLDYQRCKKDGLDGDILQQTLDKMTSLRGEDIEENKLHIISALVSKYG